MHRSYPISFQSSEANKLLVPDESLTIVCLSGNGDIQNGFQILWSVNNQRASIKSLNFCVVKGNRLEAKNCFSRRSKTEQINRRPIKGVSISIPNIRVKHTFHCFRRKTITFAQHVVVPWVPMFNYRRTEHSLFVCCRQTHSQCFFCFCRSFVVVGVGEAHTVRCTML